MIVGPGSFFLGRDDFFVLFSRNLLIRDLTFVLYFSQLICLLKGRPTLLSNSKILKVTKNVIDF